MKQSGELDDPRRRLLVQALSAGFFSAGWTSQAMADIFGSTPAQLPPGQSVYRVSGLATVNGAPATLKTRIGPKDTVETGRDGEIVFVVGSSSFILRNSSRLVLDGRQEGDNAITSALRLVTGKLLSVFGKSDRQIRMQSTTATIGIRGTGVYMESEPDQTYFCTCYGIADISAADDPESKDTVAASHHDRPLYIMNDAKAKGRNIRRAPFKNHSDPELMLIETLVGRSPPFVFPGSEYDAPRRDY